MRYGCIYIIKNKINDKVYIGQTTISARERFRQHMKPSNYKKRYKFYKAVQEYGNENFYYEILEDHIPLNELNEKEIYYISLYDSYKNGYNSTPGGDGRQINKIDDINYIKKRLSEGENGTDIAKELNVSVATVKRAILSESNKTLREHKPHIDDDILIELHSNGYDFNYIAEYFGVNIRTVRRHAKKFNLKGVMPRIDYSNLDINSIIKDINEGKLKKCEILRKYNITRYQYDSIKSNKIKNSNDYPDRE